MTSKWPKNTVIVLRLKFIQVALDWKSILFQIQKQILKYSAGTKYK